VMLFDRIMEAHTAIRPQVPVTPLDRSPGLSAMLGCDVLLKAEHLQPTGSFKVRGATNKLHALGQDALRVRQAKLARSSRWKTGPGKG